MIDTDWDGTPDALVPSQSNFAPGSNGSLLNKVIEATHAVADY